MITSDKVRIYEKYDGDIDGFARSSKISELDILTDQDWRFIDEILQRLLIIQSGLGSTDFEEQARAMLMEAVHDENVRERLFQLSKPKN